MSNNTSNPESSLILQPGSLHFPTVPSYVVALSVVGGVVSSIVVLFMAHLIYKEKKNKKQRVDIVENLVDDKCETEKLREAAVEVEHLHLSEDHCLVNPNLGKTAPSPSIFSQGDIHLDVFEIESESLCSNYSTIFSRGDFLLEVMENVGDASNVAIPDLSRIGDSGKISDIGEQVGTLEVFEDNLHELEPNAVIYSPQRELTKLPLFPESILTYQSQGLSPQWDSLTELGDEGDSVAWRTIEDDYRNTHEDVDSNDQDKVQYKFDNEVTLRCSQIVLEIFNSAVSKHCLAATTGDGVYPTSTSSRENVEQATQVHLSVLPLPFTEISTSYLEVSVFSPPSSSSISSVEQTSPSISHSHLPIPSPHPKPPTFATRCLIPSYRVDYAEREEGQLQNLLENSCKEFWPESVLPTPSQDLSTSCLDMSVFSIPSPTRSSQQTRPKLSLTPSVSCPVLGSNITVATNSHIHKVPMLLLPVEDGDISMSHLTPIKSLPSTPLFGCSDQYEYTPVYDNRQASVTFRPSGIKKAEKNLFSFKNTS